MTLVPIIVGVALLVAAFLIRACRRTQPTRATRKTRTHLSACQFLQSRYLYLLIRNHED